MRVLRRVLRSLSLALAATLLGGVLGGFLGGGAINGGIGPARAGLMEGLEAHGRDAFGRAAAFLRPHARPVDRGGIPAARHALAQIALIQGEDSPRALAEADALLDPVTRCAYPDFLTTYAYVSYEKAEDSQELEYAVMHYKEAAEAGSPRAKNSLGLHFIKNTDFVIFGLAYVIDAANSGYGQAIESVQSVKKRPHLKGGLERARRVAMHMPIGDRRPVLGERDKLCPNSF